MRLGFSHLSKHKLKHNFADSLNSLSSYSLETESTLHSFLCCQNYTTLHRITAIIKFIKDTERVLKVVNVIKTILISSSIPFLIVFFFSRNLLYYHWDFCLNILYFSPYCLQMISKRYHFCTVLFYIYIYTFFFFILMSNC